MHKHIILVEDNPGDVRLVEYALKEITPSPYLKHCPNGNQLLLYLREVELSSVAMILLDLNMPGMSGFDLLQIIKQDPQLKQIPIVVFSSSFDSRDIAFSYQLGANAYVRKPLNLDGLVDTMQSMVNFWRDANIHPKEV